MVPVGLLTQATQSAEESGDSLNCQQLIWLSAFKLPECMWISSASGVELESISPRSCVFPSVWGRGAVVVISQNNHGLQETAFSVAMVAWWSHALFLIMQFIQLELFCHLWVQVLLWQVCSLWERGGSYERSSQVWHCWELGLLNKQAQRVGWDCHIGIGVNA